MNTTPAASQKSWIGRNWLWFVPVVVLAPVLTCVGLVTVIGALVFGMIKGSDPYQDSLRAAQQSVALQAELGTPIEAGFFVFGELNLNNSSGDVDISYTVSGPSGDATVYVVGTKSGGQWTYQMIDAEVDATGRRIDLR